MKPASKMPRKTTNLTTKILKIWEDYRAYILKKCEGNDEQSKAVCSLEAVMDKLVAIVGPPGTGKTRTLADIVLGTLLQKMVFLVVSPHNKAVNKATNEVDEAFAILSVHFKLAPPRFMRLQTEFTELHTRTVKRYNHQPAIKDRKA